MAKRNPLTDQFISQYAASATASMKKTGVPASVTLAQAILESNIGRSALTKKAFNFFGIKGKGTAGSVTMRTREVLHGRSTFVNAEFRKYNNAEEGFVDHGNFFIKNKRYETAMANTMNPFVFAAEIHKAGYATDPQYTKKLHDLINLYDLTRFDKP